VFVGACALLLAHAADPEPQSAGTAGTVGGKVVDPSGAAVPKASVTILNPVTNYRQDVTTDANGAFRLINIPPAKYHVQANAPGFTTADQDIDVRSAVPADLTIQLAIGSAATTVNVESSDLLENVPYAHNDVDMKSLDKLPISAPASGLSSAITLSSGSVAADSNGLFHPLGDHAQTSFSVDGQPISDQQSKNFSTQMPLNAIGSMELITGAPPAEYGDKTSLIVNAQTRSGLGQKLNGSLLGQWGSFGTYSEEGTLGFGTAKVGNFISFNALRSGRFLDTPELLPLHAIGNNGTVFYRFDLQPNSKDAFHVNLFAARNWFQTPNTYDQLNQDQHAKNSSFNFAPSYQHTFAANLVLTVNPFFRKDFINYYPSADAFADTPATLAQHRTLANWGVKSDISYTHGRHNVKVGLQLMQTRLDEQFSLGITDPGFNAVCLNSGGDPLGLPGITNPANCPGNAQPNPNLLPGLVPFDLTRGGSLFKFNGAANINQYAFYAQDSIKFGALQVQAGLRVDQYDGLSTGTGVQPRLGLSYLVTKTGTILRASYSRTFETPYNENLVLSSATGVGGLATNVFGAVGSQSLEPGHRNQFNTGLQQAFGKYLVIDADYFWKFTTNAYDFDSLFNSPVHFPISWRKSKLDGVGIRISTPDLHGFQWITTMGHTRARFFGPETGGLIFNSPVDNPVFRIDHDQAFQQSTQLRYQRPKNGPWIAFTWRYDSGMVAGAVGSLDDALALTGAQQSAIGFFCGSGTPTIYQPLTSAQCNNTNYGATRLVIPKAGTENDDHNPPRVASRNLYDLGFGTENLLHKEHFRTVLRFTISNLTNKDSLYNFLSTFSGTHFVEPRAYQAAIGFVF